MPEFVFDGVSKEDYEKAESKFVTVPNGLVVGDTFNLSIEIGMIDWDKVGVSMKIPVTVVEEGPDEGKVEKISFGVKPDGIWKGKALYRSITGEDMPMKKGSDGQDHPAINSDLLTGRLATGVWQLVQGKKGGVGEMVTYPKLMDIVAR